MPVPDTPVRPAILSWCAAVAAGLAETAVRVGGPEPPSPGELTARAVAYALLVVLVLGLSTGRREIRIAVTVLLSGLGTLSLVVEPLRWVAGGGSVVDHLAAAGPAEWSVVVLRAAHLCLVGLATALMYTPAVEGMVADRSREATPPVARDTRRSPYRGEP